MTKPAKIRIGDDDSVIPLMLGPIGFGIPRWLPLALLYLAVVLGLGAMAETIGWQPACDAANIGPGVIGGIDLLRRLRTTHYRWVNPAGGITITPASLVDRLTFRECGWYFPVLAAPLPLWLVGGLICVIALS
ncbi:hypothetical protein [Magnetospirillum sulfuroxidans]|uniref:Uncharacterized protein n=1 Tax=Magnetospirillum sulfuroxidans TaxID=611300 RepID=A0ABS5IEG7_9PROT|nr:hypothetical protein [Magnetospirillum sulfuroxidans]MBR9972143.1 hypothetical protein [Magnetospirillum sulfuroxidans]